MSQMRGRYRSLQQKKTISTATATTEKQLPEVNTKLGEFHLATHDKEAGEVADQANGTSQVEIERFAVKKILDLLNEILRRTQACSSDNVPLRTRLRLFRFSGRVDPPASTRATPDAKAPIRCHLIYHRLLDSGDGPHLYGALSYVWRPPESRPTVCFDDGCLDITHNLFAALARLRDRAPERTLWVDAVCINQANVQERGSQAKMVAEIYARASRVIVWLGSSMTCVDTSNIVNHDNGGPDTYSTYPNSSIIDTEVDRKEEEVLDDVGSDYSPYTQDGLSSVEEGEIFAVEGEHDGREEQHDFGEEEQLEGELALRITRFAAWGTLLSKTYHRRDGLCRAGGPFITQVTVVPANLGMCRPCS